MNTSRNPSADLAEIKKQLEDAYVPIFETLLGMPAAEAKNAFSTLCRKAEDEAAAEGSLNLPVNLGDILLDREATDEKSHRMLQKRRREGATDEDIRWWMNRHELDRKLMMKVDEIYRVALFSKLRQEEGCSEEDATAMVRKLFPVYGDPDQPGAPGGEDRPLPFELRQRINSYIEKRTRSDMQSYNDEVARSTSFNALIRKEMKTGRV